MQPPKAPTAAASVGVDSPNTIEPSTIRISSASGKNEPSSILKTSSRSQVHSHARTATIATQMPNTIQYQPGIGRRSAGAASAAFAVFGASAALALTAGFADSDFASGFSVSP